MTKALPVHGVDISHHQANIDIDWAALQRAGVLWMYHKATEGATLRDSAYAKRRREAANAGLPFGAYHFARPSGNDARAEARFFIDVAKPMAGNLRPCLDLETREFVSGQALVDWADEFCDEVERLTKNVPMVYTPYTLSQELEDKALFWVPRYNNSNERPFRDWDIWQFSNGELGRPNQVAGIGHVDLNYSPRVGVIALQMNSPVPPPPSRGRRIDASIKLLENDKRSLAQRALRILKSIKPAKLSS